MNDYTSSWKVSLKEKSKLFIYDRIKVNFTSERSQRSRITKLRLGMLLIKLE